jgi:predicted DNA binding protein
VIEASLSIRIPDLWVTPVSEKYDAELSCEVGGSSGTGGWGLVTIRGDDEILEEIVEEIGLHPSVGNVTVRNREGGSISVVVDVVQCKACEVLTRSKSFMVFPVDIRDGRMTWVIITDTNETLRRIRYDLEELECDVELERVVSLRGSEVMTGRQEEVIRKAFASGYFDYPRKTNSEKLASSLGVSVSTLSEVLRAAQRRILGEHLRM